jgi:hypothetical protein
MKRLTMLAVALTALPILAEEAAKKPAPARAPAPVAAASQGATSNSQESPLVAAARRSNRLGKKKPANLITNANLTKASGARVTTTENLGTINLPPPPPTPRPTPEMAAQAKKAEQMTKEEAAAQKQKLKELDRQKRLEAAASRAEDGMFGELEDPDDGTGDRDLQKEQKPPQF